MTADKKSWATFPRMSILKKTWQTAVCLSSKSEWKDNIMEFFLWVEKLWGVFMRSSSLAEWGSLVKTTLSFHTLHKSWRAVVSGLLTYYFPFQGMVLTLWMCLFMPVIPTFDLISKQKYCWSAILLWAWHKSRLDISLTVRNVLLSRWNETRPMVHCFLLLMY